MGEPYRNRHQVVVVVAGVADHHSLVAGTLGVEVFVFGLAVTFLESVVDPDRDVGRLLLDRNRHPAGFPVEANLRARITDVGNRPAYDGWNVHVGGGGDLARYDDEPR